MIGIDTNILVRYFAQDDAAQSALANRAIAALSSDSPGFISHIVLCELMWVLESLYATKKAALVDILRTLLESDELAIQAKPLVWRAFQQYQASALDFSDALIAEIASDAGCSHTLTFDKSATRIAGFTLLKR
jgi:predicted nucleic-acid-binding protein